MGVRLMLFSFDKCAAMLTCILCIQGGSKPRFSTAQEEPKKLSDILRQVSDGNFYTNTCVQLALTRRTHRCDAHSNHQRHAAVFEHACARSHPPLARICSILPCPPCPATNSPQLRTTSTTIIPLQPRLLWYRISTPDKNRAGTITHKHTLTDNRTRCLLPAVSNDRQQTML
jgi:hypothetical protein